MASEARIEIKLIRVAAYAIFWLSVVVGGIAWLAALFGLMAFGVSAALMGSMAALLGWFTAVAGAGILILLVEIHRELAAKK